MPTPRKEPENPNLQEIQRLKSECYDLLASIEHFQMELRSRNERIVQLSQ